MDQRTIQILFALLRSAIRGTKLTKSERESYSSDMLQDLLKISAKHDVIHLLVLGLKQNGLISKDNMHEYGVTLTRIEDVKDADCVIVAVAHNEFKAMSLDDIKSLFKNCDDSEKVLIDVKGLYKVSELKASNMKYWRL